MYLTKNLSSKGTQLPSTYQMDEKWEHIINIPKQDYLKITALPQDRCVFDIVDYGASIKKDPFLNQQAIQKAIDEASKVKGIVLIKGGVFRTARLNLKSNILLKIEANSALENVTFDEAHARSGYCDTPIQALIQGKNVQNVTIEGPGQLRGNGASYCKMQLNSTPFFPLDTFNLKKYVLEHRSRIKMGKVPEMNRDFMIGIISSQNITIKNLEVYESGSWTIRLEALENLLIEDLVIDNDVRVANSDGIDLMGGKNITIRHCFIATGDDGICPKTERISPCMDNVLIENCTIMSLANHFKIGTEIRRSVTNITLKNCFFFQPGIAGGYAGIAIEAPDEGTVKNITIKNITMENVTSPLVIWKGCRSGKGGDIKDITITDIIATNCDVPCAITGFKKAGVVNHVANITLKNFDITYRQASERLNLYWGRSHAYGGKLNLFGYPEITKVSHMYLISNEKSFYFDLPVHGIFFRYAKDICVENFKVKKRTCNKLPFDNATIKSLSNQNITIK